MTDGSVHVEYVTVHGVTYRCAQLELSHGQFAVSGEPFTPGRTWYGARSWLIKGHQDAYAWPMTDKEFQIWSGRAREPVAGNVKG